MDSEVYSDKSIKEFTKKNLFFNDPVLEKYYDQDKVAEFRRRLVSKHGEESLDKMIYVVVTDSVRDIILNTVGNLTQFLKPMGDMVIAGGEAFNMHFPRDERVVTSDIDTKFAPRIPYDKKYFGKLQSIKLILWDKLGRVCQQLDEKIKRRLSKKTKLARFLGISFASKGPYVTRRYTLIKKKKASNANKPQPEDVLIDVELFALDLQMRCFSIKDKKVIQRTLGGLLDIPFMRPKEFGYEIVDNQKKGVVYKNKDTGRLVSDKRVYIGGKRFLLDDVYEMQKLGLRPQKVEKDKTRMVKLARLVDPKFKVLKSNGIDAIYRRVKNKVPPPPMKFNLPRIRSVNVEAAARVNPAKYARYTTKPEQKRLAKAFGKGVKLPKGAKAPAGYTKTHGRQRFDVKTGRWVRNNTTAYVGNQFTHRKNNANTVKTKTLYGFNKKRDSWVPRKVLENAKEIPFVGLKK
jgi:hypothetical protein